MNPSDLTYSTQTHALQGLAVDYLATGSSRPTDCSDLLQVGQLMTAHGQFECPHSSNSAGHSDAVIWAWSQIPPGSLKVS